MDKSLIIRVRKYFWHRIDPFNNHFIESDNYYNQYNIWDVICDSIVSIFVVSLVLVLVCAIFKCSTGLMSGAYIIPVALSIDYLKRKDITTAGRLLSVVWLLMNIFVAISMVDNSWTWFFVSQ